MQILLLAHLDHAASSFLLGAACGALTKMPKWFALFWYAILHAQNRASPTHDNYARVPPVFTDTLLLVLTLYKAVSYHQLSFTKRNGGYRLFEILVRDQILYFVGCAVVRFVL